MPNQLNENASNYLRKKTLNDMKIEALTDFKVVKILRDNESLEVFTQEGNSIVLTILFSILVLDLMSY